MGNKTTALPHTIPNKRLSFTPWSGRRRVGTFHALMSYLSFALSLRDLWLSNNPSKASSQFTEVRMNGVRHQLGQRDGALFIVWRLKLMSSLEESQCTFSLSHLKTNEPPTFMNKQWKQMCRGDNGRVDIILQSTCDYWWEAMGSPAVGTFQNNRWSLDLSAKKRPERDFGLV